MTLKVFMDEVKPIKFSSLKLHSAFMLQSDVNRNWSYRVKVRDDGTPNVYNTFSVFSDGSCGIASTSQDALVVPIELEIIRTK